MPVYEDAVYGDKLYGILVRWWTCPFCDKRIITASPKFTIYLAYIHLWAHHEYEGEDLVNNAIENLWNESDDSMDEMLTKMVLDKL